MSLGLWLYLLVVTTVAFGQTSETGTLSSDIQLSETPQRVIADAERAKQRFAAGDFEAAWQTLERSNNEFSRDTLSPLPEENTRGFTTYVPWSRYVNARQREWLPQLPESVREKLFATEEAQVLLDRARDSLDIDRLRQIVEQHRHTPAGWQAMLLWGDAQLSLGNFLAAREAWESLPGAWRVVRIDPARGKTPTFDQPAFFTVGGRPLTMLDAEKREQLIAGIAANKSPGSSLEFSPADVAARLTLLSAMEGDAERAAWELQLFEKMYGHAAGQLAGKRGLWFDLLRDQLQEPFSLSGTKGPATTYAGNYQRHSRQADHWIDIAGRPLWTHELPTSTAERDLLSAGRRRVAEAGEELHAISPLVLKDSLIYCDGGALRALDRDSGNESWSVTLRPERETPSVTNQHVGVPRHTLTVDEGIIAIALPSPALPLRRAPTAKRQHLSRVVAIDESTKKVVADIRVAAGQECFCGTPVVHEGRLFVLRRELIAGGARVFVDCFEIAGGARVWSRLIASGDTWGHGNLAEYDASLLTLVEDRLVFHANLGVVGMLSCVDGQVRWLLKYPRAEFPAPRPDREDRHVFRDLAPCLVQSGVAYCLPGDCESLFAIDLASGRVLWSTPPGVVADAIHLLGVRGEFLFASGDCLYWIHRITGSVVAQFPAATPVGPELALPSPRGWGRGLVLSDEVIFPTRNALYRFETRPERVENRNYPVQRPAVDLAARNATGGHLLLDREQLFITSGRAIMAFAPFSSRVVPTADRPPARAH